MLYKTFVNAHFYNSFNTLAPKSTDRRSPLLVTIAEQLVGKKNRFVLFILIEKKWKMGL